MQCAITAQVICVFAYLVFSQHGSYVTVYIFEVGIHVFKAQTSVFGRMFRTKDYTSGQKSDVGQLSQNFLSLFILSQFTVYVKT